MRYTPSNTQLFPAIIHRSILFIFVTCESFNALLKTVSKNFHVTLLLICSCIALYSICFSVFKTISRWTKNDLECVVEKGDQLFKNQNTLSYLTCLELRRNIQVGNLNVPATFLENLYGVICNMSRNDLFAKLCSVFDFDGIIFMISNYTFSIMQGGYRQSNVYIIDSHSRDKNGRPSSDGKAVILKFENFQQVTNYIIDVYGKSDKIIQYEILFLKVMHLSFGVDEKQSVVINHKSQCQTIKSSGKKTNNNVSLKSTLKRTCSKKIGLSTTNHLKKRRQNQQVRTEAECIEAFHTKVNEGPYSICVICNRCLYKRSVQRFKVETYGTLGYQLSQNTISYDNKMYICQTCCKKK